MVEESARSRIEPFRVMDVFAAAARRQETHGDVVSLAAGQPSTRAPGPVLAAMRTALDDDVIGYSETLGTARLRSTIAMYLSRRSQVVVEAEDVVVTTGSSGAFTLLFLAAFDAGDTVVMARPGYPAYRNTLSALGCRVIELDCGEDVRFQPTVAMLDALPEPPKGLIVASPANPTGTIIDPGELAALARWCDAHGTLLISDEIYHGISYGDVECRSAREFSDGAVSIGSVSKYFSMTGWRLGWMVLPRSLTRAVQRLASNMTVCPPTVSQLAAIAAFTDESLAELDGHVRRYARNREELLGGLRDAGITRLAPADGAFYAYADIGHLTDDSFRWCADVLNETGVAVVPGADFDTVHGHHTVRFSFAGATEDITEALRRLAPRLR
ncbi:pyridoxal phosphate-dependent aminotransferase [Rhodococcus sp. BP-349]|uniref:pyridoxal phosphate-dependent aminotransferase n=1 Tax=unclassified Rhodococcus (in: high G+C Gram-positive bacteria) TaxID=192944 RepID=UPI001C9B5602|nr:MULTISPECIES: pyridoxal phosphate-dependent aminotransferase [unclassified Rhodococcus (in: high G+C Gram-positive bacteria)]MBY6538096.1 pyridoxal phosphate-dependent aminotransferase [Rhodococcus sp. BP-363]MBY6542433.1 pyridoxal phosphate-dependent aminotransferase [Rhodococcus sp. BP-369]MBY6561663.1 pyridoxal phosphate-dependent aminotransferase [Rhodococcus sp. BP-370]MBY6575955.1 pyridoxal phosphate-dependent aminotransferase [Rhodococcus sp. BP-364]MBY6585256.1 pyridoxal phosphate-d